MSNTSPYSPICLTDNLINDLSSNSAQSNQLIEHRSSTSSLNSDIHNSCFQMRRNHRIAQNVAFDAMNLNSIKNANALLDLIETLRKQLLRANAAGADFAELVSFEACMLNLEAILKVNFLFF